MTFARFAKRSDTTQSQIVDALRRVGYEVFPIGRPVDLLVSHASWPQNTFVLLECKTPKKPGRAYLPRKDQARQSVFCAAHSVPYVTSVDEAISYVQSRHIRLDREAA